MVPTDRDFSVMLPVSSYEDLLARVRNITTETIQLHHEITSSLSSCPELMETMTSTVYDNVLHNCNCESSEGKPKINDEVIKSKGSEFNSLTENRLTPTRPISLFAGKEDESDIELKEIDEKPLSPPVSSSSEINFLTKKWGPESLGLWHSGPSSLCLSQPTNDIAVNKNSSNDTSFTSSTNLGFHSLNGFSSSRTYSHQQLGAKVEMVYNLLSMLGTNNREDMSKTFLAMSSSPESCHAMRQSGCLPLLIQLIHSHELDVEVRSRAAEALCNIVHSQTDDKRRRREIRVLKLLQQVRKYCEELKIVNKQEQPLESGDHLETHPTNAVGALMKFSFDADHRQAICVLGGLHAITELIQLDIEAHGSSSNDASCITLRRFAGMSLTNLTFGDGKNKSLLCSFKKFLYALVEQLKSPSEDLRQVTASVLRNLSWRADSESKQALREVGAVSSLTVAAMEAKKESTLKSILSALWNLSAHCTTNKVEICSVPGSLAFLVRMLKYKSTTNTLAVVENAGGIIRNISSHLAVREDYRQILRDNNCFEILLEHLKSPSLTIVSNACGTLWNLSARCSEDQKKLWEMGATSMLRSLIQSKHKMISMGSSAALKNLLTANPNGNLLPHLDSTSKNLGVQNLPTLFVRKQRALEQELDITLAETCDNIEPNSSPNHLEAFQKKVDTKKLPKRSESRESIRSTQSDSTCERINQIIQKNENLLENKAVTLHDSLNEKESTGKVEDQKLVKRYRISMIPTLTLKKKSCEKAYDDKSEEENPADENDNVTVNNINREVSSLRIGVGTSTEGPQSVQMSSGSEEDHSNYSRQKSASEFSQAADSSVSETVKPNSILKISSAESLFISKSEENYKNTSGKSQYYDLKGSHVPEKTDLVKRKNELTVSEVEDNVLHKTGLSSSNIKAQKNRVEVDCERVFQKLPLNSGATMPSLSVFNQIEPGTESIQQTSRGFISLSQPDKNFQDKDILKGPIPSNSDLEEAKVNAEKHKSDSKNLSNIKGSPEGNDEILSCVKLPCLKDSSLKSDSNDEPKQLKCIYETDNLEKSLNSTPNFKVGLEISESKFLQSEANKICHEIRKYQEMDMGCSITSEVSLVSCSSFLDAGDYSLFDFSSNTVDFSELETHSEDKSQVKVKNSGFQKPLTLEEESTDFQSLGFSKDQGNWEMDLENSIVSVASISSEIADTFTNDKNGCNTYTKTNKNNLACDGEDLTFEDSVDISSKDETLNGDTLENNMEFFDDENSLHSQENLPSDFENCIESKVVDLNKKLTPKEKRKIVQERYRTYTIRDLKANTDPEILRLISDQKKTKCNSEQNKSNELDGELTLGKGNDVLHTTENSSETCMLLINEFSFNKNDIHKNICGGNDSTLKNGLRNIGPDERKELVDNAKMVAFSLKNAVQDFDFEASVTSDFETEEPCRSSLIDTKTYSKYSECCGDYKFSEDKIKKSNPDECLRGIEDDPEKKGPKILKSYPKFDDGKMKELSKGIRGRKKQLYSSPYKKITKEIKSTPGSPKISHTTVDSTSFNLTTTKSLPNVPKSISSHIMPPVLHREGTFTKDVGTSKKFDVKSVKAIPVLAKTSDSKVVETGGPTIRNKSMPSLKTGTNISSSCKTRPLSATVTTNHGSGMRTVGSGADIVVRRYSSSASNFPGMKNSSSNQSIKSFDCERSTSNVKLRNSSSQNLQGHSKTPKKEITSKIACLWKKVEDAKQKNKTTGDKRVWIGPEKDLKIPDETLVLEQEEILEIPTGKVIQSCTVQGLAINAPKHQEVVKHNGLDL